MNANIFSIFVIVVLHYVTGAQRRVLLESDMALQIQKLSERLGNLENCIQQRGVAFTGAMLNHQLNISLHEVLKFDKLVTNEGNGFNAKTGVFRAPFAGVYVFDVTIGITGNSATDVNILKNGAVLLRVYGHSSSNWETATGSVTTHLNQNDDVYAAVASYSQQGLVGHGLTTFSGFMVQPDCALNRGA